MNKIEMNQKIKVIQLIDSLDAGGAEMMAVNIANGLAEEGIDSFLCSTRIEGTLKSKLQPNVKYLFLNKKSKLDIVAVVKLSKFLKKYDINIIHAHSTSYFMAFLMKLLRPARLIVWHDHYGDSENINHRRIFPLNLVSYFFNTIISVNSVLKNWAEENLNAKSFRYLKNFAQLSNESKKLTFLKGEENKKIVCLANLRPQKDHLNLLKAYKQLQEKRLGWTLHLVGMDFKDAYSEKIKQFINAVGLSNHVFLYGSVSDTANILKQANIGVLSSKSEGLPVALLEYGLAKLPVVVTNTGACGEVVSNKVNGMLVESENYEALAKALLFLINNETLATEMGLKLYDLVKKEYGKEAYMNKLKEIYSLE